MVKRKGKKRLNRVTRALALNMNRKGLPKPKRSQEEMVGFALIVIIVAVIAIFGFRRYIETKVEVKKSVSHVKTKGGEFALRVSLAVKAKKNIENVSLIDKIPFMVKIYEKFGTVKPDKIDAKARRIQWNVGNLNAGEERVFSYVVYSKVGIVGKFSLPEALVVFEKDDEIHEVESNKVYFLSEQIRRE